MIRSGTVIIVMEFAALLLAYLAFGWPVLLVGAPLMLCTVLLLGVVVATEGQRLAREELRSAPSHPNPLPSPGLMSGFFEIPMQRGPVDMPTRVRPAP